MEIIFSNFEENNLLDRYQGRCKGSVSEKGKMKSPFRLIWLVLVSVLLYDINNVCVCDYFVKQKKIYGW